MFAKRRKAMSKFENGLGKSANRRSFLKNGIAAAGAATVGAAGLLAGRVPVSDQEDEKSGKLTKGDAAILRFLAAAEILETDLWVQYNERGGVQDSRSQGGVGVRHTLLHFKSWMGTCPSISTTILKTSLRMKIS